MVVPRTCKHIDSIFVRKPYVNEVISQICDRRSVCLFFILKNTYVFYFWLFQTNMKEDTRQLMNKIMKSLLNAEVVLEQMRVAIEE